MIELCPFCGGVLKTDGTGYLCTSCSTRFDSKEELDNFKPKKKSAQKQQSSSNAPGGTTTIIEKEVDRGVDVFEKNINSVLEISWVDGKFRHSGSGFLISKDGFAITNTHVVTSEDGQPSKKVNVKICGKSISADVIRLGDNKHGDGDGVDLALLKLANVPTGAKPLTFEKDENVRNGEKVFVIGNSLGFGTCITSGIVSDRARKVGKKTVLMTDCAVNHGNSGGPIFNEKGYVIGAIVSGITQAEGMNFAIPSSEVLKFVRQSGNLVEPYQAVPGRGECSRPEEEQLSGAFSLPSKPVSPPKPSIAPCPTPGCGSKGTIQNGIFVCDEGHHEHG